MEPLSIKCCVLDSFYFFMQFFQSVAIFDSCPFQENSGSLLFFSSPSPKPSCAYERMGIIMKILRHVEAVPAWESGKGALWRKSRSSKKKKITVEKSRLSFFFLSLSHSSDFPLILLVPMVVLCLHEHLTHGRSPGCGGVISEPSQMPSL